MADTYRQGVIGDQEIIRIGTEKLIRIWAEDEYPWLALLTPGVENIGTDKKHYWLNNPEGMVNTTLAANMVGGATSEVIVVASNKFFAVGNIIDIAANFVNGVRAAQRARITAKIGTTGLTIQALSGNLSAHANGTKMHWAGNYVKYGSVIDNEIRLANRDYNVMEQVHRSAVVDKLSATAMQLNEERIEASLTREAIDNYKQQLTYSTLFGELQDPTLPATEGYGLMDGACTIIAAHGTSNTSGAFSHANFRKFIDSVKIRRGFPGGKGRLIVNAKFMSEYYALDDSKANIRTRELDKPLDQIVERGIVFDITEEPAMTTRYPNEVAVLALTMAAKGQVMVRLINRSTDVPGEKPRKLETESAFGYKLNIGAFQTIEVRDPYRHGWFQGSVSS
jgi:hypothetical protein